MERIGFIGLGIMGRPMALHLIKAGYPMTVLASSGRAAELKDAGAQTVPTPAALAKTSDIVITMVPDSPEVESVLFGPDGVAQGMREGSLYIDMSTIAPAVSIGIAARLNAIGVEALDAPVSGGQVGAENASLSIMVGGNASAFARALPVFEKLGKNIVHIGKAGSGQVTKACNQVAVALTIQAVAEALTLARKADVDVGKVREALLGGLAQSRILDLYGKRIIDRNFSPGFRVRLHRKDMNIILQTARELSVPLHGSALVAAQMDALIAQGDQELDHSALALMLERMAGME
ncbi:MAG: 2-hydroxy-3-oxopropionate reductase [Cyclobacteriaceae bacterium]|jgi:2-hydroxy-3-oxopropionate reductase|nr:2-hydroxy-3-oxopropionate reductase [Cyclobacteriaceae bacterium]